MRELLFRLFPAVRPAERGRFLLFFALMGLMTLAQAVGLVGLHLFRGQVPRAGWLRWAGTAAAALLLAGALTAGRTTTLLEDALYDDPVIYAKSTPYQRLVITRWRNDLRLFIDGNIQFSSVDEFRYHEALVHPAMSLVACPRRVLILGGGDGLPPSVSLQAIEPAAHTGQRLHAACLHQFAVARLFEAADAIDFAQREVRPEVCAQDGIVALAERRGEVFARERLHDQEAAAGVDGLLEREGDAADDGAEAHGGSGIDDADEEVAERGLRITDEHGGSGAVGGEKNLLVQAGAERIDREDGRALLVALRIERLADHGAAAGHRGMAGGRNNGAVDAGEEHGR